MIAPRNALLLHVHARLMHKAIAVRRLLICSVAVQELKEQYIRAKALGARANELKAEVAALKGALEQQRLSAAAADIAAGGDGQAAAAGHGDADISDITAKMEARKQEYRACFDELRDHKHAIEHLQKLLEQSRDRMAVRASSCARPMAHILLLTCSYVKLHAQAMSETSSSYASSSYLPLCTRLARCALLQIWRNSLHFTCNAQCDLRIVTAYLLLPHREQA